MKRISSISRAMTLSGTALVLISLTLTPGSSLALGEASSTSAFCTALPAKATNITNSIDALTSKVTLAWSQQDQKLATDEQKVDQEVATDRQHADTERASDFTQLEAKATTSSEKQAVQTYETAVLSAVTTRRAAYDTARQTFRTGLKNAIDSRRSTVTSQLDAFKSAASDALNTAEADCASNESAAMIRQTLQGSLKTARETFQSDRKSDDTVGTQAQQLATTRDAAFKAADQAFQASLATARQTLKQAFGSSSGSV